MAILPAANQLTGAFLLAPIWNRNLSTSILASLVATCAGVRPEGEETMDIITSQTHPTWCYTTPKLVALFSLPQTLL